MRCCSMLVLNSLHRKFFYFPTFTAIRRYDWKNPRPTHITPQPPKPEKIRKENVVIPEEPYGSNDVFNTEYINRNPRNLEQMLLQVKPYGFVLDDPPVQYWNKLYFERTVKHVKAKVIHNTGETVVSASTEEWAIQKKLYSTIDANAVINIARILAFRCLQSGILFVHQNFSPEEYETPKIKLFLKTLEEEGLDTKEMSAIRFKDDSYL